MEVKGKYKKSVTELYDCTMSIENGIIHRVIVPRAKPIEYFSINPKNNAEFEYYKLPTKKGIGQIGSNYKIEYENESKNINSIYVNLNTWDLFKLKRQKKELLIQDKGLKIAIVVFVLTNILSFVGGVVYQKYNNESNKITKADSEINEEIKTDNNILEPKEHLQSDLKPDI